MPLFTYKCTKCETKETKLVKVSDTESIPLKCKCGGDLLRIFDVSNASYILKGNWFSTTGKY